MPAKSEISTGFWITLGVLAAVLVAGVLSGFVFGGKKS